MAMWDGSYQKVLEKWHWKERRVWWPGLQCERSHKFLFLKKAYYGTFFQDWEYDHDMWLSKEEFLFAQLRGDFSD